MLSSFLNGLLNLLLALMNCCVEIVRAIAILFIPYGLFDYFYLGPRREKKREIREFDMRVLAILDGLFLSCPVLSRYKFDLPGYAERMLEQAHKLPAGETLYTYHVGSRGYGYCTGTDRSDYVMFAVLCIARFAEDYGLDEVLAWCDSVLPDARFAKRLFDV